MIFKQSKYFNNIKGLIKEDVQIEFDEDKVKEIYKCKNSIEYMLSTYCKVVHQEKGEVNFDLYDFQKRFIKEIQNNNRVLGLVPRQSGKTTSLVGYIIHYAIFNKNKNIGILADRLQTSRKILKTVKDMYKRLPEWLQVGVVEWNKTTVIFANGVKIMADSTSENSLVGEAMSLLIVDEVAKINPNLFSDFMDSVMPTISSSESAKIVMFSTARGLNHWFKMWTEAKNGISGWVPFEVFWNEIPGRDEAFKQKIINEHNETHFLQEYCNSFLGSSNSLISMTKLQAMPHSIPIKKMYDNRFNIYELPNKDHQYYNISDYGEGLNQDYSTIQVFKKELETFVQVAAYRDNQLKPREFAKIKLLIAEYYNDAVVIGESNIGKESLNELFDELEYANVFFDMEDKDKIGLRTTKKTKKLGCSYLKKHIENNKFEIVDFDTINELSTFVSKKNSYEADVGCTDDLIIPLVMFAHLINNLTFTEWYVDDYDMRSADIKVEKEDILPFFLHDGEDYYDCDGYEDVI